MSEFSAKQALIRATMDVVAENGLNNFSMKKVTDRVGVSETLIYKHFGTKDNLLYCCYEAVHSEIGDLMSNLHVLTRAQEQGDLYQSIRLFWMIYFDFLVKQGNATLFYFAYRDSNYYNRVQETREDFKQIQFKAFVDFVDSVDAQVNLYEKTSEFHLWTYILDATGMFAKRVIRGELPNTPGSIENIWKLIFGGIAGVIQN